MRRKFIILILISLILICGCIEEIPQQSIDLSNYAYLPGRSGGQILNGGITRYENLTLNATTNNQGLVKIQPEIGLVGIGKFYNVPVNSTLHIIDNNTDTDTIPDYQQGITLQNIDTDNTVKRAKIKVANYKNSEEPNILIYGVSASSLTTYLYLGGGTTDSNAVSIIRMYTGAIGATLGGTERLRIDSYGNVSIGASAIANPSSQLTVSDAVRFMKFGAGTATFDAGGNISSVSDEKYKTNIVPFTSGLLAILNTNPKQFKYNAASGLDTQNTYTGFVAQDLQKSIPQAVYSKPDVKYEQVLSKKATEAGQEDEYTTIEVPLGTNTLSIDDRAIIATLVNAVKEQQLQINDLKSRIDKLEGRKP